MVGWNQRDRGQAFPIYVMMVAGLLFLALAFFAVGKASALRNGAQGAADASALAAAQSTRERFEAPFIAALWANSIESFLNSPFAPACDAAQGLASDNDAELLDCFPQYDSDRDSITTRVKGRGLWGHRCFRALTGPTRQRRRRPSSTSGVTGPRSTSTTTRFRTSIFSPVITAEKGLRSGQVALPRGPA